MNKALRTAILLLIFLFPVIALQSAHAQSSQPLDVRVTNFPETQQVKGAVSIEGTMSHARYWKREGLTVPPSRRNEISELTLAGTVDTEGFTSISVNLQGEIKSGSFVPGAVGVVLIPDEEPVLRALREAKRVQFPIESVAHAVSGDTTFSNADQAQQRIMFSRYRIYLYNTVNRAAEANVYLYLSN